MKRLVVALAFVPTVILANPLSTQQRVAMYDLNYFKPDCARKDEQLRWLSQQMPTQWEYIVDRNGVAGWFGQVAYRLDGTLAERQHVSDRRLQAVLLGHAEYLNRFCPPPRTKPAHCVSIREDFPSGSAIGTRCYSARNPKPVVNRWEPMVDN